MQKLQTVPWRGTCPRSASASWRQWPGDTLSYVSHCGDKTSGKDRSRKEGFTLAHSLGVQSITVGKSRQQELATACHFIICIQKAKRECWYPAHSLRTPA